MSFQSFVIRHLVIAPVLKSNKLRNKWTCDVIDDRIVVVEHGQLCIEA